MNKKEKTSNAVILKVKVIGDTEVPEYVYNSDVGFDLKANEDVEFAAWENKAINTGLIFEIPKGYVGLIRDRAGFVTKMGMHTTAGTIDSAYRGEVSVVLINDSGEDQIIEKGMRIAQMILVPVKRAKIIKVEKLENTERGEKGFGSTGINEELDNLAGEIEDFVKSNKPIKKKKK
ncbi:MAG: dUTP diphosphatase [Candidatus Pacearchaeota archaeon]